MRMAWGAKFPEIQIRALWLTARGACARHTRGSETQVDACCLAGRAFTDSDVRQGAPGAPAVRQVPAGRVYLLLPAVVDRINQLEATLSKDSFFTTHWLDVILYYLTLLCEPVRLKVAEVVAARIAEVGGANVHVLAHSLGTAVVHDALAKTYGPDNLTASTGKVLNLSPIEHRLGGVHMVANVSRALQTFVKVGSSIVRPGELGCTSVYME